MAQKYNYQMVEIVSLDASATIALLWLGS